MCGASPLAQPCLKATLRSHRGGGTCCSGVNFKKKIIIIVYKKIIDKTTILISQVFFMCVIDPLSFKGAQLVPQILKLSCINPFTNCISDVTYVTNETII